MTENRFYSAFGLTIRCCFPIPALPEVDTCEPDVTVVRADLSEMKEDGSPVVSEDGIHVFTESDTKFRVSGGNLIEADIASGDTLEYASVYLLGSCMGAILIQRGFMLLHGSCVTNGRRSILITGASGAGKSTLAAEFLKQGWKLITDDVTTVFSIESIPTVRSSYPSQKLWQDAMERYGRTDSEVHSLITTADREKFGINVIRSFYEGTSPLSMVVRLLPADHPCEICPIEGIAKVDQILRNSYRACFIDEKDRQRHFQRCVTLAGKLPMALAVREKGNDCADTLYELITKHLEEHCHD